MSQDEIRNEATCTIRECVERYGCSFDHNEISEIAASAEEVITNIERSN